MAIKLIKACKELNIGMSTAVEFAAKQGKEIAADPNIRIDDELYLLLAKAFNRDMALKLEAEKQAQERLEREIPKTVSVEPTPEPELLHPVQKPKVLGKIDLQTGKKIEEVRQMTKNILQDGLETKGRDKEIYIAVISMALMQYQEDVHDVESGVLTIQEHNTSWATPHFNNI